MQGPGRAIGRSTFQSSYAGLHWDLDRGMHATRIHKDLNNGNDVIGTTRVDNLDRGQQFTIPPLSPLYPLVSARAINDRREVVGRTQQSSTPQPLVNATQFVWDAAAGFTFLPGLNGGSAFRVHPSGVNSRGEVVGHAVDGSLDTRAFVWDARNGMRDLNTLTSLPPNIACAKALDINEAGWICGSGIDGTWSPPLGIVLRPAFAQSDLGGGGPGNSHLQIAGRPLSPGNHADIVLIGAPVATPGVYAISVQSQPVTLFGGTLHANPPLFSIGFVTTQLGANLHYGAELQRGLLVKLG